MVLLLSVLSDQNMIKYYTSAYYTSARLRCTNIKFVHYHQYFTNIVTKFHIISSKVWDLLKITFYRYEIISVFKEET